MKENCQFYPQDNYLWRKLLKVRSNLVFQSTGKFPVTVTIYQYKTQGDKKCPEAVTKRIICYLPHLEWNSGDITDLSFRDFLRILATTSTWHSKCMCTEKKLSPQSNPKSYFPWSGRWQWWLKTMWLWTPEDWKSCWFFSILNDKNHPFSSLQTLWSIQRLIQYFPSLHTSGP